MAANRPLSKSELQQKLRRKAVRFFKAHDVESKLESLLNEMFAAQPNDVYGYMSEYFHSLSLEPVISSVKIRELLDTSGDKAVEVELYCTIDGVSKKVSSWISSFGDDIERDIATTKTTLDQFLKKVSVKNQKDIDQLLEENVTCDKSLAQAISYAAATAAAMLSKIPLYRHITIKQEAEPFTPLPLLSMLAFGRHSSAKLKFSEFLLSPASRIDMKEQLQKLIVVYKTLWKTFTEKQGPSGVPVTSFGAYCPVIDKVELVLDLLQDSCREAGLQQDHVDIWINVTADNMFDQDKGKYELCTGAWKATDDLINIYCDLQQAHPNIKGFISPLHSQDAIAWQKLATKLQDQECLLISGSDLTDKLMDPEQLEPVSDQPQELPSVNCASLNVSNTTTVSHLHHKTEKLKGVSQSIMADLSLIKTHSQAKDFAEMAVGLGYNYIKLGAPRGLHTITLSTLLNRT